jgi:hypothetical protein
MIATAPRMEARHKVPVKEEFAAGGRGGPPRPDPVLGVFLCVPGNGGVDDVAGSATYERGGRLVSGQLDLAKPDILNLKQQDISS